MDFLKKSLCMSFLLFYFVNDIWDEHGTFKTFTYGWHAGIFSTEKIELLLIVGPCLQELQWSVISKEAFLNFVNRSNWAFK